MLQRTREVDPVAQPGLWVWRSGDGVGWCGDGGSVHSSPKKKTAQNHEQSQDPHEFDILVHVIITIPHYLFLLFCLSYLKELWLNPREPDWEDLNNKDS